MLTIGIDAHKRVHAAVAIDAAGQERARWRGGATVADGQQLQDWAMALGPVRRWGIEGLGQYGHGLAQQLVAAGEAVVEVNPCLSDRLDALAVARVVVQEGMPCPPWRRTMRRRCWPS